MHSRWFGVAPNLHEDASPWATAAYLGGMARPGRLGASCGASEPARTRPQHDGSRAFNQVRLPQSLFDRGELGTRRRLPRCTPGRQRGMGVQLAPRAPHSPRHTDGAHGCALCCVGGGTVCVSPTSPGAWPADKCIHYKIALYRIQVR